MNGIRRHSFGVCWHGNVLQVKVQSCTLFPHSSPSVKPRWRSTHVTFRPPSPYGKGALHPSYPRDVRQVECSRIRRKQFSFSNSTKEKEGFAFCSPQESWRFLWVFCGTAQKVIIALASNGNSDNRLSLRAVSWVPTGHLIIQDASRCLKFPAILWNNLNNRSRHEWNRRLRLSLAMPWGPPRRGDASASRYSFSDQPT